TSAQNMDRFLADPEPLLGALARPEPVRRLLEAVQNAPEGDARLEAMATLRLALLAEAERLLVGEALPIVPLYFYVISGLVKPEVQGFYTTLETADGRKRSNLRDIHPLRSVRVVRNAEPAAEARHGPERDPRRAARARRARGHDVSTEARHSPARGSARRGARVRGPADHGVRAGCRRGGARARRARVPLLADRRAPAGGVPGAGPRRARLRDGAAHVCGAGQPVRERARRGAGSGGRAARAVRRSRERDGVLFHLRAPSGRRGNSRALHQGAGAHGRGSARSRVSREPLARAVRADPRRVFRPRARCGGGAQKELGSGPRQRSARAGR